MPHNNHTDSPINNDVNHATLYADAEIQCKSSAETARTYYLALACDWQDPFDPPVLEDQGGFCIVRDDLLEVGSKARFGSLLVQKAPRGKTLVYVAPRFGFAAISLAFLCRRYKRKLVLFMPACERVSEHQAVAIEMGATPKFARIAAMPNLNKIAKEWADKNNGYFIPLGLKHELVTACIVRTAVDMSVRWAQADGIETPTRAQVQVYDPVEVWTAISTGVLSRALQIAWPNSRFRAVAVARNIQLGERGHAQVFSSAYAFAQNTKQLPPFPSAPNYDAKVWHWMITEGAPGALMWNVAGSASPKFAATYGADSDRTWADTKNHIY
jgi:hypothetical protein